MNSLFITLDPLHHMVEQPTSMVVYLLKLLYCVNLPVDYILYLLRNNAFGRFTPKFLKPFIDCLPTNLKQPGYLRLANTFVNQAYQFSIVNFSVRHISNPVDMVDRGLVKIVFHSLNHYCPVNN